MAYILLYRAASGSVSALQDGRQFEKRLARARGSSEVIDTVDTDDAPAELMASENGFVSTNSGYMMEFCDKSEVDLPIIDVAKKPGRKSYRITTEAVESLPVHILSKIEEQEYVRIEAEYDSEEKLFEDVTLGWDAEDHSPLDRLMEEIDAQERVTPVVDYLAFTEGDDRWTPETIADVRDVEAKTVRQNIKQIRTAREDDGSR